MPATTNKFIKKPLSEIEYNWDTSQWYVIITRSNYEFKFKRDVLDNIISNKALNTVENIFVPIKKFTIEYVNSAKQIKHRIVTDKIISLYVFLKAKMTKELLNFIYTIPSAIAILTVGSELSTVTEEEIENYKQQCIIDTPYYKGCKIIKSENPFVNDIELVKYNNGLIASLSPVKQVPQLLIDEEIKQDDNTHNKIITTIYKNEQKIKAATAEASNKQKVITDTRINFDQININRLSKLLNKYALAKEFNNLDFNSIPNINSNDLEQLKQLLIQQQVINSAQGQKRFNQGQVHKHNFYKKNVN